MMHIIVKEYFLDSCVAKQRNKLSEDLSSNQKVTYEAFTSKPLSGQNCDEFKTFRQKYFRQNMVKLGTLVMGLLLCHAR